jgi:hypothetical protein
MKKTVLSFILLLGFLSCTAQYEQIENQIKNYVSAGKTTIPDIRELMIRKIDSGLTAEAKQLYRYIYSVYEPKGNLVFYNDERILICYLIAEYDYILERIAAIQDGKINKYNFYRYGTDLHMAIPTADHTFEYLQKKALDGFDRIIQNIYSYSRVPETADLLTVYFLFFNDPKAHPGTGAAEIMQKAASFLKKYPGSAYNKYIKNTVLKNILPKDFRYGMEWNLGLQIPKGNMQKIRKTDAGFSVLFNVNYKKWLVQTGYQLNSFDLQKNLLIKNDTWQKDSVIEHHEFNIQAGYFLIDTKRIGLVPNIGAGFSLLQPAHNGPTQNIRTRIFSSVSPNIGLKLLWKCKKSMDSYSIRKGGDGFNYWALGFRYSNYTFPNYRQIGGKNISVSLSFIAHLADFSSLFFFYWNSHGNRDYSW